MIKKVLWQLVVVGAVGLLSLSFVAAQEAGVSRSLPAGPVAPGDELEVTISNVGLADGAGVAVETLPAGFSYVDDSAVVNQRRFPGGHRCSVVSWRPDCLFQTGVGGFVHVQGCRRLPRLRKVSILSPAFCRS